MTKEDKPNVGEALKKAKKKMSTTKKIVITFLSIILLVIASIGGYGYYKLSKIKTIPISKNKTDLGIKPEAESSIATMSKGNKITNILLLGIDDQEKASDTNIVLSIDDTNKKLKITSIMRDSYIDFQSPNMPIKKINYAYHYGGPQLSIKTVNDTYNLDIKDYIKVDFKGLANVIDAVGGVQVNVKPNEVDEVNGGGAGAAQVAGRKYTPIKSSGLQTLTGLQATGYCRIRHIGNNDYERTQRQRTVLMSLFDKVKSLGPSGLNTVATEVLPYVETSLSRSDILAMASKIASFNKSDIDQYRIPIDGTYEDSTCAGTIYILKWDKSSNVDALHKFIYDK